MAGAVGSVCVVVTGASALVCVCACSDELALGGCGLAALSAVAGAVVSALAVCEPGWSLAVESVDPVVPSCPPPAIAADFVRLVVTSPIAADDAPVLAELAGAGGGGGEATTIAAATGWA